MFELTLVASGMVCFLVSAICLGLSFAFFNANFESETIAATLPKIVNDSQFNNVPLVGMSRKKALARCAFLNKAKNRKSLWIVACHVSGQFFRQYDVIKINDFESQRRLFQIDLDDSYFRVY